MSKSNAINLETLILVVVVISLIISGMNIFYTTSLMTRFTNISEELTTTMEEMSETNTGLAETVSGLSETVLEIAEIVGTPTPPTPPTPTPPTPPTRDILISDIDAEPITPDPAVQYSTRAQEITINTVEPLTWTDGANYTKVIPWLAESWEESEDGTVFTFYLREGVKFHSGYPFNASAVKYSLDRTIIMNDPAGPAWLTATVIKGGSEYMASDMTEQDVEKYLAAEGVKVIDEYTVQITLESPIPDLPALFAGHWGTGIVDPYAIEEHGGVVPGERNPWMEHHISGTGPYKLVEWVPNEYIRLERFDDYWRGPAPIKTIILNRVDEQSTRLLRLLAGESDITDIGASSIFDLIEKEAWLSRKEIVSIYPEITVSMAETLSVQYDELNHRRLPFSDVRMRLAWGWIFPYDAYHDNVLNGLMEPCATIVTPNLWAWNETLVPRYQNVTRAKELIDDFIDDTGWQGTIDVIVLTGDESGRAEALMQKDLIESLDVGITLEIRELSWSIMYSETIAGDFDAYVNMGWYPDYYETGSELGPFILGLNNEITGWHDEELIELFEESITANTSRREWIYKYLQWKLYEGNHFNTLGWSTGVLVHRTAVDGLYFHPLQTSAFYFYPITLSD